MLVKNTNGIPLTGVCRLPSGGLSSFNKDEYDKYKKQQELFKEVIQLRKDVDYLKSQLERLSNAINT